MRKIQNIQALRGVAVLSVVLFHLIPVERKYGGSETILPDIFQFGMFGVDLFFVISGFVMVAVTKGGFQNHKQALTFIYHRASRIYPTYWVYTILVFIVFLVRPSWVNSSQGGQVDVIASFLLLPSQTLPLVAVGWTLIHELYFYLVFFLVLLIFPEKKLPIAISLWGALILLSNIVTESNNPVIRLIAHPLTLEFIGGCFLAIIYYRGKAGLGVVSLLVLACFALLASLYGYDHYRNITGHVEPASWWRILIFGVPALLLVFCFTNAETKGYVIHSSLVKIGNASYSIYLSHVLTLSVFGKIWSMFSVDAVHDNLIMIPVLFMMVIVIGFASYHMLEKPLLELSRKIA